MNTGELTNLKRKDNRRKLGTIDIYAADPDEKYNRMSSATTVSSEGHIEVTLRPLADIVNIGLLTDAGKPDVATIMAHELGHAVAMLTGDITHDPILRQLYGIHPAEAKAWALAHALNPAIKADIETAVLKAVAAQDAAGLR